MRMQCRTLVPYKADALGIAGLHYYFSAGFRMLLTDVSKAQSCLLTCVLAAEEKLLGECKKPKRPRGSRWRFSLCRIIGDAEVFASLLFLPNRVTSKHQVDIRSGS